MLLQTTPPFLGRGQSGGGGGGGTPVDPSTITDVTHFWSPSKQITKNSDAAVWLDTAGEYALSEGTASRLPDYNSGVPDWNGGNVYLIRSMDQLSTGFNLLGKTVLMRIRPDTVAGYKMLLAYRAGANVQLRVEPSGAIGVGSSPTVYGNISSATGVVTANNWHVVGFQVGTSEFIAWADNVEVASTTSGVPGAFSVETVGARSATTDSFDGEISDIVIFDESVSDADREAASDWIDSGGASGTNPSTLTGFERWFKSGEPCEGFTSLANQGSGGVAALTPSDSLIGTVGGNLLSVGTTYLSFPDITGSGTWYFRFRRSGEYAGAQQLATDTTNNKQIRLDSSGYPEYFSADSDYGSATHTSSTATTAGTWHTLRVSCLPGSLTMYLDGTKTLDVSASGPSFEWSRLGEYSGNRFIGDIRHVCFYDGEPSGAEDDGIRAWLAAN